MATGIISVLLVLVIGWLADWMFSALALVTPGT